MGIQRDAVRSTKSRKVLVPGLNWLVCAIPITQQDLKIENKEIHIQTSSWYKKTYVTFSDVLAYLRRELLEEKYFSQFGKNTDLWDLELQNIINEMAAA